MRSRHPPAPARGGVGVAGPSRRQAGEADEQADAGQVARRRAGPDLEQRAREVGRPPLPRGPHDAGSYNSRSWETGFFVSQGGSWSSEYGGFFLGWYSGLLVAHADRVLGAASEVLARRGRPRV